MYSFSWLFDLIETQRYGGTPISAPDGREKLFNILIHNYLYEWGKTIKAEHYFFFIWFFIIIIISFIFGRHLMHCRGNEQSFV